MRLTVKSNEPNTIRAMERQMDVKNSVVPVTGGSTIIDTNGVTHLL